MVDGDKPPNDKGQASDPEGSTKNYKVWKAAITIAIHTKNKLGFINGKLARPTEEGFKQEQGDRCNYVVLNWIFGCVSQDVFMSQVFSKNAKIHSLSQSGSPLFEYYHKFNALWRQYDSLANLLDCICENSDKLKKHNQLGAFATLSRDESNRGSQSHTVSKPGNSAFVARPNTRNNNWTSKNNQPRKLNRPNLVCTHCNMNDHTANRCSELVGYPPNFKKNNGLIRILLVVMLLQTKLDFEKDETDNVCDVNHKAKQTKDPFPLSEYQTKDLGQNVHLDI
ncbi:ribonuclease H-like domain-containing protein [Tanacetum coccineum]|uniref:Ribonuclease H-like domain-containing protein n=1 Tax=Tanacetum coccineum TaxID=301880 RepID=A0ABQ5ECX9_9ASTR